MGMQELLGTMRGPQHRPEPVTLVQVGRRWVEFTGSRSGDGPLTVGQSNTWLWVRDPTLYMRMVEWVLDLPEGTTVDDIARAFAELMARHESLRTTYPGGEPPVQRVARSGKLAIELYGVDARRPDPRAMATALVGRLRVADFDLAADFGVRVGLVLAGGLPRAGVVVYSHMAVDLVSMTVIGRQFTELAAPQAAAAEHPAVDQPLDQARAERTPRGRRTAAAALRHWEHQLSREAQCLYAVPRAAECHDHGSVSAWLWSPAAARALPHIAQRTGASRQAAVLAALCTVLALRTGQSRCTLTMLMHNRIERRLRDYVGSLANNTILTLDTAATGFDAAVQRAGVMTLRAGRGALVADTELYRVISDVEYARGTAYVRDCVFNDASCGDTALPAPQGDPEDAARALADSELHWVEDVALGELLLLYLGQVEREMVLGALTSDPSRVPRHDIESLLRGAERLLVAAAAGDVPMDLARDVTGVVPVTRGPGWVLVDSCWVELAEVQRLAEEALHVPAVRVFAESDATGQASLVAYLAAGNGTGTPEAAHAACMTVLPRSPQPPGQMRPTAMAPGKYVVCDGAPADPADLLSWQRQQVLASGAGRASV